jgi:hypothetical protein
VYGSRFVPLPNYVLKRYWNVFEYQFGNLSYLRIEYEISHVNVGFSNSFVYNKL